MKISTSKRNSGSRGWNRLLNNLRVPNQETKTNTKKKEKGVNSKERVNSRPNADKKIFPVKAPWHKCRSKSKSTF